MSAILVLNGPNLNLLGEREPEIYGSSNLTQIEEQLRVSASRLGVEIDFRQTNSESQLVEWLQSSKGFQGIILNAAAFTHYSISLRDACAIVRDRGVRIVECHLSNPAARETFRHQSVLSSVVTGVVSGFGVQSYVLALQAICSERIA